MYLLINIYAPNKDKCIVNFLNNLLATLKKENLDEEEYTIMEGDFNCPLNIALDKKGGILIPRKSVITSINCIQDELDLQSINHLVWVAGWPSGRVVRVLDFESVVPGSNPTLTTSWICFSVVPSYKSFSCACI